MGKSFQFPNRVHVSIWRVKHQTAGSGRHQVHLPGNTEFFLKAGIQGGDGAKGMGQALGSVIA